MLPRAEASHPVIHIRRREDLLRLEVTLLNASLDKKNGRITPSSSQWTMVVNFGPQAVTEQAVTRFPPTVPVKARVAGKSQLSFLVDGPLSAAIPQLLRWAELAPRVDSAIGQYLDGEIIPPYKATSVEWNTAIEMPWWLVLSPHRESSWTEQVTAKTRGGRTEVFHTRLATWVPGEGQTEDPALRTVRAVALGDPNWVDLVNSGRTPSRGQVGYPFEMIPTPKDRADIFKLTSRTGGSVGGNARAIKARMALSPLGGYLVAEGAWDEPAISSMTSWQQRIWQGRDTYAKVVRAGFLYPWGFKAAQVEEGVRVFRADSGGKTTAFWEKRTSIVVTDPDVNLSRTGFASDAAKRAALFQSLRCVTVQTPPLQSPRLKTVNQAVSGVPDGARWAQAWSGLKIYVPEVLDDRGQRQPLDFEIIGLDQDDREVAFRQPLLFVERSTQPQGRSAGARNVSDPNFDPTNDALGMLYDSLPGGDKVAKFGGAVVAFARSIFREVIGDDGSLVRPEPADTMTQQRAKEMIFALSDRAEEGLDWLGGQAEDWYEENKPASFPSLAEGRALLDEAAALSGLDEELETALAYPIEYLRDGFDELANEGAVFLESLLPDSGFTLPSDRSGGVMSPGLNVAGLSRTAGQVYGDAMALRDMASDGRVTPGEAFKAIELLGGVSLADLLPNPYPAVANGKPTDKALTLTTEFLDTGMDTERLLLRMQMEVRGFLTFTFATGAQGRGEFTATGGERFSTTAYTEVEVGGRLLPQGQFTVSADRGTLRLNAAPPARTTVVVRCYPDPADGDQRWRNSFQSTRLLNVDRSVLAIDLQTVVPMLEGEGSWSVRGEFSDAIVNLVPLDGLEFVKVDVARLVFTAGSGKSPDVDVDVRSIDFSGLLSLVKTLAEYLPFGDQLAIDINSEGISAAFFIDLPAITLGAFSISGIAVGAGIDIPFSSGPVRFGFLMSRPENPFSLAITGLGGGGWVDQALGLKGIERFSIATFFGADAKVNFGVASGGVAIRAGFQFAIGPPDDGALPANPTPDQEKWASSLLRLTAFASLNGNVDVLGIVKASIDIYIGLTAEIPSTLPDYAKLHGVARCTIRVKVAFWSETVEFPVERRFNVAYLEGPGASRAITRAGEGPLTPATFADAMSSSDWAEFCGAFR